MGHGGWNPEWTPRLDFEGTEMHAVGAGVQDRPTQQVLCRVAPVSCCVCHVALAGL